MFRIASRWARRPMAISVVLHVAILGGIVFFVPSLRPGVATNSSETAQAGPQAGAAPNFADSVAASVGVRLGESLATARALTPEKQLETAMDRASQLEKISSVKSMLEISEVVQRTMGTTKRAYKPVANPPPGEFLHDDSLVHSVIRKPNAAGVVVKWFVLVDREGRTVQVEVGAGEETTAAVMERLGSSEILREFKDGILLPILNQHLPKKPAPQ